MVLSTFFSIASLIVAIAIPVGIGFGLSTVAGSADTDWYRDLEKPSWTPPNWVFPVVWTIQYVLIGVASWLVWKEGGFGVQAIPLAVYVFQLVLNFAWTPLFFALRRPDVALGEIVLLWLAVLANIYFFFRVRPLAGYLLIPYILWVTLAATLNASIVLKNPNAVSSGYDIRTPLKGGPGLGSPGIGST